MHTIRTVLPLQSLHYDELQQFPMDGVIRSDFQYEMVHRQAEASSKHTFWYIKSILVDEALHFAHG